VNDAGPGSRSERERTAYHEAGHAVVAFSLGSRIKMVTIKPDGHYLGWVETTLLRRL